MKTSNTFERLQLLPQLEMAERFDLPLHWVPYVNLLLLFLGLLLFSSHWLCPPGLSVRLPKVTQSVAFTESYPTNDTLTLDKYGRVFFRRKLYTLDTFDQLFPKNFKTYALLVKADIQAPLEILMQVITRAYERGCQRIQIAVNFRE